MQRARPLALMIVALTPVWLALLSGLLTVTFERGVASRGAAYIAGIPLGLAILGLAGILTLAGVAAVRWWRRPWAGIALFTIPATLLVLFGPAVILIVENLGNGS
jgi:hypothetical protein